MIERTHYEVKETALTIVCDGAYMSAVKDAVHTARYMIEKKISDDPYFGTTFDPYPVLDDDPPLIRMMCQSSIISNVGPMAGVAGAIAYHAVETVTGMGCDHIIVENGGDICMRIDRPTIIGIHSGEMVFKDVGFLIEPTDGIVGVCSSSGKVGPSVSFGVSGVCTVFSDDVILADCCATAFGNMISEGTSEEMTQAAEDIASVDGISGCIAVCNGLVAMCGDIPKMVRTKGTDDRITSILF